MQTASARPDTPVELSYRALLRVPGFAGLWSGSLLARTGNMMQAVVLVLFVLERFHSPVLAGLTLLFGTAPGLLIAPLAGALLDRGRRLLLIASDYALGAGSLALLALLGVTGAINAPELLLIVGVAALTTPLSNSGTRSLYPFMVPRPLWDRANAFDSNAYLVAQLVGPAIGGVVVALAGGPAGLLVDAAFYAAAVLVVLRQPEPAVTRHGDRHILTEAAAAIGYVLRNRVLGLLALTMTLFNLSFGIVYVALPVLVLQRMQAGASVVGALFAVMAVGGIAAGFAAGRIDSDGRERWFIAGGAVISAAAMLLLAGASVPLVAVVAMVLAGVGNAPLDIGLFSLRQRVTDPRWLGRAFAVSASLNFAGFPLGSALGGPVVEHSVTAAMLLASAAALLSALVAALGLSRQGGSP